MDRSYSKAVYYWLLSGVALIALMVLIGGITRLTGSGLSITEWKLVSGTLPPLSEEAWQEEFNAYKQIPQFKELNFDFQLADFKQIYWWEYIHRLIGRLIGLIFVIPLIYFLIKKQIPKNLYPNLVIIFLLGGFQGFLGWYMVSSGLSELTSVSHLRLAAHLFTAFITLAAIYLTALKLKYSTALKISASLYNLRTFAWTIFFLLCAQLIYGALTAGLHAGHIYNTWPKMGDEWIAESVGMGINRNGLMSFFYDIATVQFVHRLLAVLLFVFTIVTWLYIKIKRKKHEFSNKILKSIQFLFLILIVQFTLGVVTLITNVQMHTAITHQFVAVILFMATVYFIHSLYFHSERKKL